MIASPTGILRPPTWLAVCVGLAFMLGGCATQSLPRPYPEGERIFHADPRWRGGDAAISVPLGDDRVLWLFGDSFIDPVAPHARREAAFVHNSIALQVGLDPREASMHFAWGIDDLGAPASFFPDGGEEWFWPAGGIRLADGALAIFLHRMTATGESGPLAFAPRGHALALIADPDAPPETWTMRIVDGAFEPAGFIPGAAVLANPAGTIVLAIRPADRSASLVFYPGDALARGDLRAGRWWAGATRGWLPHDELGGAGPAAIFGEAAAEASLHASGCFVAVASHGFGPGDIAARVAARLTGPWSAPATLFHPPESDGARPFVYAGKAHAALAVPGDGTLAVTYVANSFTPADLLTGQGERDLYWPRMALVEAPACPR